MHIFLPHLVLATDFPPWLRATHWVNVLFFGFMVRSGIQILGSYPRLYWNDHSKPGTEWLKFTRRKIPQDRLWITLEEEVEVPPVIGQPGGNNLGLGRHWHFFAALFWLANGIVYVVLLIVSGNWMAIVPTSWSIFPQMWHTFLSYLTFHAPPATDFTPYDPLQKVSYGFVVFILAPFQILTAAAQSPAIEAQFPWYSRLWGGRQAARSLHFIGLVLFIGFVFVHTLLIILVCACGPHSPALVGYVGNLGDIVLGQHLTHHTEAVLLGIGIVVAILLIYAITSFLSLSKPRTIQHALGAFYHKLVRLLSLGTRSHQKYTAADISDYHLINGAPPSSPEFLNELWRDFTEYRLEVRGLVERPLCLTLDDLFAMPKQTQIVQHNCIQGWSSIAEWGGVPMREIFARCKPLDTAKYAVFTSYSEDTAGRPYYEVLDLDTVKHPQALLAYEMNNQPLPLAHGAPLRLRVENQLGFKMVKWLKSIEFVETYATVRAGDGGSREENKFYEVEAGI